MIKLEEKPNFENFSVFLAQFKETFHEHLSTYNFMDDKHTLLL